VSESTILSLSACKLYDNDNDFITNEVKRRLKELRRNNFMC
jgi:hypothetical protein